MADAVVLFLCVATTASVFLILVGQCLCGSIFCRPRIDLIWVTEERGEDPIVVVVEEEPADAAAETATADGQVYSVA